MESITLSAELVLPVWDCPSSSAERDGLIDQRRRRVREQNGKEKRKEQECGYLEVKWGERHVEVWGGSEWLADFPCVFVIIGELIWLHQLAWSSAAALNAAPAYITWLFAGRCCGLMARHIDHCLFAGNERTGERQFLICPSFPFSKYRVEICYIVFIQAENCLLGIRFLDHFWPFLSLLLLLILSLSVLFRVISMCMCVLFFSCQLLCTAVFYSFVGSVLFIGCLVPPWTIWLHHESLW